MSHIPQTDTFRWVHFLISALVVPVIFWFVTIHERHDAQIAENGSAIASMKSNRFTSADGLAVWQEIGAIRERMAELPPPEFRVKMDRLGDKIDMLNDRLARVETKLDTDNR